MALDDIIKKILSETEDKAQSVISRAEQEAEGIKEQAKAKARDTANEIIKARSLTGQQEALRILSLARMEARRHVLLTKQKLLNKVFSDKRVLDLTKASKEVVLPDEKRHEELDPKIYLEILRRDCEAKVAKILFEQINT